MSNNKQRLKPKRNLPLRLTKSPQPRQRRSLPLNQRRKPMLKSLLTIIKRTKKKRKRSITSTTSTITTRKRRSMRKRKMMTMKMRRRKMMIKIPTPKLMQACLMRLKSFWPKPALFLTTRIQSKLNLSKQLNHNLNNKQLHQHNQHNKLHKSQKSQFFKPKLIN